MASSKPTSLDHIFGTHAAVRVLRALTDGAEHAPPRIARETKVSRPAVREALIRLEKEGVVERVGDGRNVLYRISSGHPLAKRIVKLFKAEAKRAAALAGLLLLCASPLRYSGQGMTRRGALESMTIRTAHARFEDHVMASSHRANTRTSPRWISP